MCDTTNYTITLAVDTKMVKYKVRMYMHGVSLVQAMRIHGYGQRLRSAEFSVSQVMIAVVEDWERGWSLSSWTMSSVSLCC